jgi:hypothetical protein
MAFSLLLFNRLVVPAGWPVMAALLVLFALLVILGLTTLPLLAAWLGTAIILAAKHWPDLAQRPRLRLPRRGSQRTLMGD